MRATGILVLAAVGALAHGDLRQGVPVHPAQRRTRANAEARLQALVKGLKLDAAQEAEVRRALRDRRDAIRRLANAPLGPDVSRVALIHAITDRTSERIRAVLDDEQKRLYGQALPRGDLAAVEGKPDVEQWLNALRQKGR
jgi:hypothetical protein